MDTTLFYCILTSLFASVFCDDCIRKCEGCEQYLATKTPYRLLANLDDSPRVFDKCEPKKIWMMNRHGTRNCGSSLLENVNNYLKPLRNEIVSQNRKGNNNFCSDVIEQFQHWEFELDPDTIKDLTMEGEDELLALGERFQKRYPGLFPDIYSSKYQVGTS